MNELLTFEEWYALNEDIVNIELAESGADREMDFDSELEFNKRYETYYNKNYATFRMMFLDMSKSKKL